MCMPYPSLCYCVDLAGRSAQQVSAGMLRRLSCVLAEAKDGHHLPFAQEPNSVQTSSHAARDIHRPIYAACKAGFYGQRAGLVFRRLCHPDSGFLSDRGLCLSKNMQHGARC